ncbi:hypothetical protein MOO44_03075 [Nicoliella spurrieriana]|uniref:Uncharacterized protein n=1 Tax=Nicoliella spurrieriana TaxID=2925830 RepID=A0A976RSV0_9LACO|nr:hypothetical protein [Nicoliella spurrieriana]UQS87160.1 hypothetical protein MOO44_03075 [Nicoliella spurrieriana]
MQNKELNIGALCSLLVYILINVGMWLGSSLLSGEALIKTAVIAALLYGVPMGLATLRFHFAYHLLGLIMIFYTISFITAMLLITDASISIWLRIINLLLGALGIVVNVVWFQMVFKNSKRRVEKRLKQNQKSK